MPLPKNRNKVYAIVDIKHHSSTSVIPISLFLLQGFSYYPVAPSGNLCYHKDTGTYPRLCWIVTIISRILCESECDKYTWCAGYSHLNHPFEAIRCHLITSEESGSCPSGYTLQDGNPVTAFNQLMGHQLYNKPFSGCYGKVEGKYEEYFIILHVTKLCTLMYSAKVLI